MDILNFDYNLPSDLIAQKPSVPKDESRLLSLIDSRYKNLTFSGVQPTGNLHLGNYLGALKNFVDLQNKME